MTRALVGLLLLAVTACRGVEEPSTTRFEGETMGTTYVVLVVDELSESERIGVSRLIDGALEDVNRKMSHYLSDSEISRFNRSQPGVPFPVTSETFFVLREAVRVSELTGGAFDVTVAPLVRLWGFGPEAATPPTPPGDEALREARGRVGYRHLRLDDDAQTVTKTVEGLECDLSAIAKGYAVDRVAELLGARGLDHFMVEVGGEVRTLGKNAEGEAWRIGIEKPIPGTRAIQRTVSLTGLSMATSGDYRNFYEVEGKLFSHLIDPRLGRPVEHRLASVSVVHQETTRADALASGLLVLGPEEGYDLSVERDLAVLFLSRTDTGDIEERASPAFADLFLVSTMRP